MTTHIVEIRHPIAQPEWRRMTREPMAEQDANDLCSVVLRGRIWEARVAPYVSRSGDEVWRVLNAAQEHCGLSFFVVADYEDGSMTTEDVLRIMRPIVFEPFNDVERWQKAELVHGSDCPATAGYERWATSNDYTNSMGAILGQADRLASMIEITTKLGMTCSYFGAVPRVHNGRCTHCKATASATSMSVEVHWGDRRMVREYVL